MMSALPGSRATRYPVTGKPYLAAEMRLTPAALISDSISRILLAGDYQEIAVSAGLIEHRTRSVTDVAGMERLLWWVSMEISGGF